MRAVKLKNAHAVTMPPVCVACGAPALPFGRLPAGGSDWTGKRSIKVAFPLCTECLGTLAAADSATKDDRRRLRRDPRYRQIAKSVKVTPGMVGEATFRFANGTFADAFEDANESRLTWLEKKYAEKRHAARDKKPVGS